MANKIILYILETDGTIPTYISDGGYLAKPNQNSSPQDFDLVGATIENSTQTGSREFETKQDLEDYASTFIPESQEEPIPDDGLRTTTTRSGLVAGVWAKKIE